MPALRYIGSSSSWYWIRPTTSPSSSIANGTTPSSKPLGSPHRATTVGCRWISSTRRQIRVVERPQDDVLPSQLHRASLAESVLRRQR